MLVLMAHLEGLESLASLADKDLLDPQDNSHLNWQTSLRVPKVSCELFQYTALIK